MTLGQRISEYRKKLGVSQEELGDRLGVSRQAVSKWETDVASPDMENLLALSREFGISVAELTATPEETPLEPPAPEPSPTGKGFPWKGLCFALLACVLILGVLWWNARKNVEPSSSAQEEPESPQSDFALLFDWMEPPEFLELGEQKEDYPFGVDLFLQGPDTVVTGDNGETVHTLGDLSKDNFRLSYAQYEDGGQTYRILTMLECVGTKEISTPRGIHVGSTKAEVVGVYGMDLVYCVKQEYGELLTEHDYYYAYQPQEAFSLSLCFFMKDGLVAGIRVENMQDLGNDAYAVDNLYTFPILTNGDPDYSHRQDIYQEPVDATRSVYIAWNALVTRENLSAEERYAYRRDVFSSLPEMDWQEFMQLGGSDDPVTTAEAFADWLRNQESFSEGEIYYIQRGSMAKGLDGAYSENYASILAAALAYDPVGFAKQLAYDSGADESQLRAHVLTSAAYGIDYPPARASAAVEKLDAAIGTNALTEEENAWARLLRYYLANPNNGDYSNYPKTPEDLPA